MKSIQDIVSSIKRISRIRKKEEGIQEALTSIFIIEDGVPKTEVAKAFIEFLIQAGELNKPLDKDVTLNHVHYLRGKQEVVKGLLALLGVTEPIQLKRLAYDASLRQLNIELERMKELNNVR